MADSDHSRYLLLPEHHQQPGRRVKLRLTSGRTPGFSNFSLGTCQGAIQSEPTLYALLAVTNRPSGNGAFRHLMRHLLALGRAHQRDLLVLEIKTEYLYQHLVRVYGMQPVAGTRHLLLRIGGPGSCPVKYREQGPPNPIVAKLLELVTNLI